MLSNFLPEMVQLNEENGRPMSSRTLPVDWALHGWYRVEACTDEHIDVSCIATGRRVLLTHSLLGVSAGKKLNKFYLEKHCSKRRAALIETGGFCKKTVFDLFAAADAADKQQVKAEAAAATKLGKSSNMKRWKAWSRLPTTRTPQRAWPPRWFAMCSRTPTSIRRRRRTSLRRRTRRPSAFEHRCGGARWPRRRVVGSCARGLRQPLCTFSLRPLRCADRCDKRLVLSCARLAREESLTTYGGHLGKHILGNLSI